MKILFFIPRMGGGGAERVVANLANEFDKRGNSVVIYTPTDNKSFYRLNPNVKIWGENYYVSKKKLLRQITLLFNGIRLWFSYKRRIDQEKPDIIISFLTETNCIALMHKYKKCKLIVSERNDPTRYNKVVQTLIKKIYPRANVLVCQSKKVSEYFNCRHSVVIPNPIDNKNIPDAYIGERMKVIVGVGRLTNQKNFANLINAFSKLNSRFDDYKLEIYGEGPLRRNLENLIAELNLNDKVKLMGAHKDVLRQINNAALFVMSSDYEGYPNALAEAMAIGLPVISTDFYSGVARELILENNGLIVPINDSAALTKAMENLLDDPEKLKKLSAENVKIREKLSISNIADKWFEIIN